MEYRIYQIKKDKLRDKGFISYEELVRDFGFPREEDYDLVYSFDFEDELTLDQIYEVFNLHRPEDFQGHSLSVSDVIYNGRYWYVDSFGFEEFYW